MNNIFDLKDKVAVVTGGAGLLGTAITTALARFGATVYLADVNEEKGKAVCQKINEDGFRSQFIQLDITDEASVEACIKNIVSDSKKLDVWINNAYPRTDDWNLMFEQIPFSSWRKNIDMHLNGYCLCCQKVCDEMKKGKGGSIINIASIYGVSGVDFSIYEGTNMTMPAAYSVIKGGVVNFTRYLASYFGKNGIRVNCISPGGIYNGQPDHFVKRYSEKVPLGRMADAEDVVGAVVYLASDASKYVTGQNVVVDGGWTIC